MNVRATKIEFLDGVRIELTFQDGKVVQFNIAKLFEELPQFKKLEEDQKLFKQGYLEEEGYGIIWNDDLDISTVYLYNHGEVINQNKVSLNERIGLVISSEREKRNLTQTELSKLSGVDQGDISKIEKGQGNPTLKKISKLLDALEINIDIKSQNLKKTK